MAAARPAERSAYGPIWCEEDSCNQHTSPTWSRPPNKSQVDQQNCQAESTQIALFKSAFGQLSFLALVVQVARTLLLYRLEFRGTASGLWKDFKIHPVYNSISPLISIFPCSSVSFLSPESKLLMPLQTMWHQLCPCPDRPCGKVMQSNAHVSAVQTGV